MFEAYSVAIRLKLIDSVSSGLIGMAAQFGAFNRHVGASQASLASLEGQLKRIKMMGLVGGIATGVGLGGLALFRAPLEEAKAWQQEAARFASLGFGSKVNSDAQQFALGMKTYGTSARDNLTLVSDAMAVFKDLGHAEMAAPILAKMKFANEAVFGEGGRANESKFMDMLKVIEFRGGLSSAKEFETQANFVQKVIAGSRGRVDATQLLMALKTGGVGLSRLNNEAFYLGSEPLIQEFGGGRFGTAVMSIYQNLVQARGTVTAQQELYRLGLLDPKKVVFNQLGQLKKALPGAFYGSNVLETEGPLALLNKVLLPAFQKKGITSDEAIIREFGMILGNRTGSGLMSRIYQQRATIEMQSSANRNAQDINQLNATAKQTPAGKMIELHKKWQDVLRELGNAVLPIAIKGVEGLTVVVRGMLGFMREFPTLTKGITVFAGVLLTLVATGGILTLATAGFKGLGLAMLVGKGAGIGAMLLEAATGMGALGLALGGIGLAAASIFAVYEAVKYLNEKDQQKHPGQHWVTDPRKSVYGKSAGHWAWNDTSKPDWSKSMFANLLPQSLFANPLDQDGSPFVKPAMNLPMTVRTQINMDGRKVAETVTTHQARAASMPFGGANFDDTLTMPSVVLNQAH